MQTKNIKDLFSTDVRSFSIYDCQRSLPSGIDGMKPAMRKIVFGMLKEFPNKEIKVSLAASAIQSCVPGSTTVTLSETETYTIHDLYARYGDSSFKIVSYNVNSKCLEEDSAKVLYKGETDIMMCIELDDGNKFYCTPDHRLLTSSGWKFASDISDNDEILSLK